MTATQHGPQLQAILPATAGIAIAIATFSARRFHQAIINELPRRLSSSATGVLSLSSRTRLAPMAPAAEPDAAADPTASPALRQLGQ